MPHILVTNDDGVDSPGLHALARGLEHIGEMTIVAPTGQRSWIGKAITRHDPIAVTQVERAGFSMYAVDGTPADCSQIGLHNLTDDVDLVVSGINIGNNYGSAYVMGSGTIGAALEASISGVPAIAASASSTDDWAGYNRFVMSPESADYWARNASAVRRVVDAVLANGFPKCDVLNVNMPFDVEPDTPIRGTRVAGSAYSRVFKRAASGDFVHDYQGLRLIDAEDDTDIATVLRGEISVTPLVLHFGGTPGPDFEAMFE